MRNWGIAIAIAAGGYLVNMALQADRDDDGAIVEAGNVSAFQIRVGDCFDDAGIFGEGDATVSDVPALPCAEPHDNEVYAVFDVNLAKFPEGDELNPTYLGYSVGRWENPDTLLVENKGFNENSWLDYFGHPHTDKMEVVERWTRPNKQTLHYEATVTDPGAYSRPFTMAWDIPWREGGELPEYICQENNRYLNRLEDDLGQPIFGPRPQPGQKPSSGTR